MQSHKTRTELARKISQQGKTFSLYKLPMQI